MSGECQLSLQQQLQQQRYGLSFDVQQSATVAGPWLAACRRDGTTLPGSTTAPPPPLGTADYWLRHRVDHQQTDPSAPTASCYFNRHQGKFSRTSALFDWLKSTMKWAEVVL